MDYENQEELHDDENDMVETEEAFDGANAEADSVKSVSKTNSVKQAPARKGDKKNSEAPKNGGAKIGAMYDKMKTLSKEELEVAYELLMREDFAEVSEVDEFEVEVDADFTEDLNALVDSEATLSEEFKAKTSIIFEAAIKSKVKEEVLRLEDEYATLIEEETAQIRESLVDQVDGYLNYAIETWMTENEVAVTTGLRAEIAENFMKGFFDLCQENYIEVPESKVDLVDELAQQVEGLEEQLSTSIDEMIGMSQTIESITRESIVVEASSDLAHTQAEKLADLVEELDFDDAESFAQKVLICKESYFGTKVIESDSTIAEETNADAPAEETEVSYEMQQYVTAVRKNNT
jgi:hypothetical protein